MTKETELAWAAGFFDGEGCSSAHIQRRGKWTYVAPVMSLVQARSPELPSRFQRAIGVGTVTGPFFSKNKNRAPVWRWVASGSLICEAAFATLRPYLCNVKIAQFEAVREAVIAGKRTLKGRPISPEHRARLIALAEARRGIPLSAATRQKLSDVRMGHPVSEKTRQAVAAANRGRIVSAETREKMRASALKRQRPQPLG